MTFAPGDIVDSMYGRCKVDSATSSSLFRCTPLHWRLAMSCVPVFNLNPESMKKVDLVAGTAVRTGYGGKGTIDEVRSVSGVLHYIVSLKTWKLAQGQSPILYLEKNSVSF